MVSDLVRREQESFAPDPVVSARDEEERIKNKLQEEIVRIRAMHNKKNTPAKQQKRETEMGNDSARGPGVDKERMLKVTWDVVGGDYSATRLKGLFQQSGEVEDIVIRSPKKKGSALVVLASKEAAIAALGCIGDPANPLLVLPLKSTPIYPSASDVKGNLVGALYQAFENSVLEKLAQLCLSHLCLYCSRKNRQRRSRRRHESSQDRLNSGKHWPTCQCACIQPFL